MVTVLVGDYGEGVEKNFDAVVELSKCLDPSSDDPRCREASRDPSVSDYRVDDGLLEATSVSEPVGSDTGAPDPQVRIASYAAAVRNGTTICTVAPLASIGTGKDPETLAALGSRILTLTKTLCGQ